MTYEDEIKGEIVMGWPDRKRSTPVSRKDPEGRTFLVRSP